MVMITVGADDCLDEAIRGGVDDGVACVFGRLQNLAALLAFFRAGLHQVIPRTPDI